MSKPPSSNGTPRSLGWEANGSDGPRRLSQKRREKLLAIKHREELKDTLLNDIRSRFKSRMSEAKIQKEVDGFVRTAGLTSTNLDRLERRLQKRTDPNRLTTVGRLLSGEGGAEDDALSVLTGISNYSAPRSNSRLGESREEIDAALNVPLGVVGTTGISQQPTVPERAEGVGAEGAAQGGGGLADEEESVDLEPLDWSKLDQYASILHAQDEYRVKSHSEEMKRKLRNDLDQQVADRRLRKQRQQDEELKFSQDRMEDTAKWLEEEEKKETSRREKQAEERSKREEMRVTAERQKRDEKEKKMVEDRMLLAKIAKELEKERSTIIVRKEKARAQHQAKEEERIREQIAKDEAKQKQLQEDLKMMRQYQEIMQQQELKRQEDVRKRVEKQKLLEQRLEKTTTAQAANDREEQEKVDREREELARRSLELDRNKAEKHKKLTDETQAVLFKQMEEKSDEKRRTREAKMEAAQLLEMDTKDYHEIEKQKADERRRRNMEHRAELERQIALRNRPFPGIGVGKKNVDSDYLMSETEMRMNRKLIKQVRNTLADDYVMRQDADLDTPPLGEVV